MRSAASFYSASYFILDGRPGNPANERGWWGHDVLTHVDSHSWVVGEYKRCSTLNAKRSDDTYLNCPGFEAAKVRQLQVRFYGKTHLDKYDAAYVLSWKCKRDGSGVPIITCRQENSMRSASVPGAGFQLQSDGGSLTALAGFRSKTLPKRRKHLVATIGLRIVRVLNLYPPMLRVDTGLPLTQHPFKIPLADLFKQQFAVTFDVLSV
jgi:hypothetical protein